ncbi:protein of unknown function [Candidatus Methylocalor cossyra]|uniref:Uncharacterized protein n=1 Tax=Candidatus Methylocalor cossyra TaxID=3108543 RepID=A0ABM9NLR1_9GAMM
MGQADSPWWQGHGQVTSLPGDPGRHDSGALFLCNYRRVQTVLEPVVSHRTSRLLDLNES